METIPVYLVSGSTNYFTEDKSNHSAAPFPETPMESPRPGSYSIVILRLVIAGKIEMQIVVGEVYPNPVESVAPNVYKIAAVLDLNGDGKFEVIVRSFYYEGGQTTLYECGRGKIEPVLSEESGASRTQIRCAKTRAFFYKVGCGVARTAQKTFWS